MKKILLFATAVLFMTACDNTTENLEGLLVVFELLTEQKFGKMEQ